MSRHMITRRVLDLQPLRGAVDFEIVTGFVATAGLIHRQEDSAQRIEQVNCVCLAPPTTMTNGPARRDEGDILES